MTIEHLDALIIGGNMRGLLTASLLSHLGYRAALVELAPFLGGADSSFDTAFGDRFEFGMHVLDKERSPVATRLLTRAVGGAVHTIRLRRGMVLRGHLVPYAPERDQLPPELRDMLPPGDIVDDLRGGPPTRARLGAIYGDAFADLIFDEVLPSYPTEARHLAFGVPEHQLLANIYPWFFPRARRETPEGDESRSFHDRLRAGVPQDILYPREGGFGGFAQGLIDGIDPASVELISGARDLEVVVTPGTHDIEEVRTGGRRLRADQVFWAGSWPALCGLLEVPCQDPKTDRVVIGSFRLDRPATCDYHEVLVGDPSLQLNRVYFPARFRESSDPLMQVEFSFPEADPRPRDAAWWRARWEDDLRRLGVLDGGHRVEQFDFKSVQMHFNGFGMEGEALIDADPSLIRADSNVHAVVPSMANLNLNAYLPRTVRDVVAALAGDRD